VAAADDRDYSADELRSLLQRASQTDGTPALSLSELESVLGPHDGVEKSRTLFSTQPESYWNLPDGKRIQARVFDDVVPYVGPVQANSTWELVWK
jgi:hypothetical protein